MLRGRNSRDHLSLGLARGRSPYKIKFIGVRAIPLWLPCHARSKRFIILVPRNISYETDLGVSSTFGAGNT
jgi:hypothetical protein